MGNNLTTQNQQKNITERRYTDNEIKQNMKLLFELNKNNLAETSMSLNAPLELSPTNNGNNNFHGGAKKKFQSKKNRHLAHNIEEYVENFQKHYGGNNNEINEFNRIKEYLINDMNGGGFENSSDMSMNSNFADENKTYSLFNMLNGGKFNVNSNNSTDITATSSSASFSDDSSDENNFDDSISSTSSKDVPTIAGISPTSDSENSSDNNNNEPYVVQSTESSLDTSDNDYNSDNSLSESSGFNGAPFYSSISSENKHPYLSKRFRH